ncbi:MAG: NB-ARC domain-containing protein [Chloroflexota bacterium]
MMNFCDWLKRYRAIRRLTQQDLAEALGYAEITYRRVERGATPSATFIDRLIDYLDLPADEQTIFRNFVFTHDHPDAHALLIQATQTISLSHGTVSHSNGTLTDESSPTPHSALDNLPMPRTPLIGRADQVNQVGTLLQKTSVRLVTLTGSGGVGKTRLALQVAADLKTVFPHGVWFIDLASVTDPDLVFATITQTLGLYEQDSRTIEEQLQTYVQWRHMLLVLDNFEQVLSAAPRVIQLLDQSSHLKILITSRVRLRVQGEHAIVIPPLLLPSLDPLPPLDVLAAVPSVDLLLSRAQTLQQDVALTEDNASAIAAICHRVAGLPLALELAAARLRLLSPPKLLIRLVTQDEVLTEGARDAPPRHQSMFDTIEWSYRLLIPVEQQLFLRLAIFRGGCTLEALEEICGGTDPNIQVSTEDAYLAPLGMSVIDVLSALLDSNLITRVVNTKDEPRFGMLVPIQSYALERLKASSEVSALAIRHATYYLTFAEQAEVKLAEMEQPVWLDYVKEEYDNLRGALSWAVTQHYPEIALHLGRALWRFWYTYGYMREGCQWLDQIVVLEGQPLLQTPMPVAHTERCVFCQESLRMKNEV